MSYNYNDGPECIDDVMTQMYSHTLGRGIFGVDECNRPIIKKISRYTKNSFCAEEYIINYLKKTICPICKQKPDPTDTVLYYNPHNGGVSWFCNCCHSYHVWKWDCWHPIPAHKRKDQTSNVDFLLLDCIVAHEGSNIKQLSDLLEWSYGKTRAACKRLSASGDVRIEEINKNGYRESKLYLIPYEIES